jgi:hypothetical protein
MSRVASHLSNLPTMATEAFTSNFIERIYRRNLENRSLSEACWRNMADAKRHRTANRIKILLGNEQRDNTVPEMVSLSVNRIY